MQGELGCCSLDEQCNPGFLLASGPSSVGNVFLSVWDAWQHVVSERRSVGRGLIWLVQCWGLPQASRCSRALEEPLPWVLGCVCQNPHFGGVPAAGPAHLPAAAGCVWHVVLDLSFRSLLESIVPQHTPGTHSPGKTD